MRRKAWLVALAVLVLGGVAEAQPCNGCGIGYWYQGVPATGGTFTGQILFPDGTSAGPAWAFAADTDLGVWRIGNNALAFGWGGANRFYLSGDPLVIVPGAGGFAFDNSTNAFVSGYVPDLILRRDAAGRLKVTDASGTANGQVLLTPTLFANLGTPTDGTFAYCSDCAKATPCAGSGSGALAKRLNGAWDCD